MPIRIQIQGFDDQNLENFAADKKIGYLFDQKLLFTYPLASIKAVQATGEAVSPKKRTSSTANMKFLNFSVYVGNFCPPGSVSGFRTNPLTSLNSDPMRIRIRNTGFRPRTTVDISVTVVGTVPVMWQCYAIRYLEPLVFYYRKTYALISN
jgi:hypothetical protein